MALKPDREELQQDISYFMNETAERGGIATISTVGSGTVMDSASQVATYVASPSGKVPCGILMNDVVNIDQTRQHLNWHKDEVQYGSKVCLLTKGWVVTNMIEPAKTPTAGAKAYVGPSGYISTSVVAGWDTTVLKIGEWKSIKDEDGYAKVAINIA